MSDMADFEVVPPLTLGWRLKMALDMAGISNAQMAEALGVNRATISRWMADRGAPPRRGYIVAWSNETRVGLHWLESGVMPDAGAVNNDCCATPALPTHVPAEWVRRAFLGHSTLVTT